MLLTKYKKLLFLYSNLIKVREILNAQVVYQVAKALPREEQNLLLEMLQKEFSLSLLSLKSEKKEVLTQEDAIEYLLKNVFNRK